ncbi:unnamed protein product [Owenia fusiformis]|uniref:Uncharacterized protein n=1 Tax=Owenia fusiformis TaxID=6347 RepID=A0A8J1TM38_OWEFU|nr:unnamed protein product [Owenia fusiformis]
MMEHSLVQERVADINSTNTQLPPLNNLPQWSRINTLDRARYPKPFLKDRLQPLPNTEMNRTDSMESDDQNLDMGEMDPSSRIHHLERSIIFLRAQHRDVLTSLHDEIEILKKENKDLHFKFMISQKALNSKSPSPTTKRRSSKPEPNQIPTEGVLSSAKDDSVQLKNSEVTASEQPSKEDKQLEIKTVHLEEELFNMRLEVQELQNRNEYLSNLVNQLQAEASEAQAAQAKAAQAQIKGADPQIQGAEAQGGGEVDTTTNIPAGSTARPPTVGEYEAIIRHLQATNDKQNHELMHLKSDLRDVLYSHKWTPDAFLLAKAYVAEEKEKTDLEKLPKISLRNPTRKLPDVAYASKENVSLPALKSTVGNKATERKKRTQILQKSRMRKEVLH